MLGQTADIQPLFLGMVLAWAGGYKLAGRRVGAAVARSALTRLVGERRARLAYQGVGGAELVVAGLLLTPPVFAWKAWLAAAMACGFLAYLGYARVTAPESSCGCMSADSGPVTWRGIARAGLLLVAALAATRADVWWVPALGVEPVGTGAVLVIESGLLLALSPDLDRARRRLLGRIRALVRPHPFASTADAEAPIAAALSRLHRSTIYLTNAWLISSDVRDFWDDGEWWLVTYVGRLVGETSHDTVTIVFAVPKHDTPDEVRMVVVDDEGDPVPAPRSGEPLPAPVPTT